MNNNKMILRGKIKTPFTFSHEIYGEKFYTASLEIKRLSENSDLIPILVPERVFDCEKYEEGDFIEITGQLRTYNGFKPNGGNRLKILGFANEIRKLDCEDYKNEISVRGFLCKEPNFRTTPFGRKIADLLVAVNRDYHKSDYLPCIIWGRNAQFITNFPVGTELVLKGRIQSRNYMKVLEGGKLEEKTALELSVSMLDIIAKAEEDTSDNQE